MYIGLQELERATQELLKHIDAMDDACNEQAFNDEYKNVIDLIPKFEELALKVNGELNAYKFKCERIKENELREELEGHYFLYGTDEYLLINKIGYFDNRNNEIWLEDCSVSGMWFPMSRIATVASIGTKTHVSLRYSSLVSISKEDYKKVFDEQFSCYIHK